MIRITGVFILLNIMLSCSSGTESQGEDSQTKKENTIQVYNDTTGIPYILDRANSKLMWSAKKPTGTHHGTIHFQQGTFFVSKLMLGGGKVYIDMSTIADLDINNPEYKQKLENHLKSADFFDVATFPHANFEMKRLSDSKNESAQKELHGNLTIKGITKPVHFPVDLQIDEEKLTINAPEFFINRADWNVRFKSKSFFDDLRDDFIYDEVGISFQIIANRIHAN